MASVVGSNPRLKSPFRCQGGFSSHCATIVSFISEEAVGEGGGLGVERNVCYSRVHLVSIPLFDVSYSYFAPVSGWPKLDKYEPFSLHSSPFAQIPAGNQAMFGPPVHPTSPVIKHAQQQMNLKLTVHYGPLETCPP
ncbi:hypothetical protein PoB_005731300 [Plakobranchus ocellatus]|uniref:Uncharacterized protein n=1 Tax=Plakobranchus ocellatus TaxID=259542 RepID=A0AAV4CIA9_9GAST|nr:hypothetical protein PoB_005731300 [Plakobranchus ocellatus]